MAKRLILVTIIVLILAILALSGCIKIEKTETVQETSDNSDTTTDTASSTATEASDDSSTADEDDKVELPSELVKLIGKGKDSIRNAKYIYRYDPFSQERHGIFIKSSRIKYELPEEQRFFKEKLFDTIYLDLNKKTAVAYCEHPGTYKCSDPNRPFDVDYSDFVSKNYGRFLYSYWYDLIENNAGTVKVKSTQQVFDREAYVIEVKDKGTQYTVFLDSFSGMILRVVRGVEDDSISNDGEVTSYEPAGMGKTTDADVEHQRIAI